MTEHREIEALWLVSPDVPNRIDEVGQAGISLLSIAMACNSGKLGEAVANNIAGCHNGCRRIEAPETTVPELVAVCDELLAEDEFGDGSAIGILLRRLRAVSAKMKKTP